MTGLPLPYRRPFVSCILVLLVPLAVCACSNRASIAARATVEMFYGAIQNDNMPLAEDNLAQNAAPQFRTHVQQAATAAQGSGAAQQAVQVVRIDPPVINGDRARVRVVFADGQSDDISLVREGLRWKVLTTRRLE